MTRSYAALSRSTSVSSSAASAVQRAPAAVRRCASSSVAARDFGRPATIPSSEAPSAPASPAAEPPPGVGLGERNASSREATERSVSFMDGYAAFVDGRDGRRADADQIYRISVHQDRVHQLAGLEAAGRLVQVERIRAVDRGG